MRPTMRAVDALLVGYQRIALSSARGRREPVDVDRELRESEDHVAAVPHGVVEVRLVPREGELPRYHPGAHVDVVLPSGTLRQYTLCGAVPRADEYRIAVRAVPDGEIGRAHV